MHNVKKIWKARGKRQAMSRGAKEKPSVSQLEMLKPVIQFAVRFVSCFYGAKSSKHTHLDDNQLSSAVHLARLGLPYTCCGRVHTSAHARHNSSYHHTRDRPTAGLDDSPNGNDGRAKYDLTRPPKYITSPDSAHGSDEAADVVDGGHHSLHVGRWIAERMKEIL
jgi:hypothetical protein